MTFADFRNELISINDAARQLHLHVSTIHRWSQLGVRGKRLRTRLVGGRRFINVSDLQEFLAAEAPQENCQRDHVRQRRAQNLLQSFGVRSSRDGSPEA